MRCRLLSLLLLIVFTMTGCAGHTPKTGQQALDFRTALMEQGGCSFTAQITADYGSRVYSFTVDCVNEKDRTQIQVLEPESIADIRATVSADGTKLAFDGAELDFGKLANGHVSPITAPWLIHHCWIGEYIAWSGNDGDLERVTYLSGYDEEELTVDTWFSDGIPIRSEVVYDGVRCLVLELSDFQMNGSQQ